jgi:hypothetical protein
MLNAIRSRIAELVETLAVRDEQLASVRWLRHQACLVRG